MTSIKEMGGEFQLIRLLTRKPRVTGVVEGIGDDCAVLEWNETHYLVVTKDVIVDGDHFSTAYFSPYEVGIKLAESNVSDVAAMGGEPWCAFVGMVLTEDTSFEWVQEVYRGINRSCARRHFDVVGGDTTHGRLKTFSLTLLGKVPKEKLVLRKGAKEGDVIKVTGEIGASTAGFRLYQKGVAGHEGVKKRHRHPCCRLEFSKIIRDYASAMIDISDGLLGDLGHILKASKVGAVIDKEKIPIGRQTFLAANAIGEDAYDYALSGGEDFELLYTVSPEDSEKVPGVEIGTILKKKGTFLRENGRIREVENKGFDHFA